LPDPALDVVDLVSQLAKREAEVLVLQQHLDSLKKTQPSPAQSTSPNPNSPYKSDLLGAKVSQLQHLVSVTKHQVDMEREERMILQKKLKDERDATEALQEQLRSLAKELSDCQQKRKDELNKYKEDMDILQKSLHTQDEWNDMYVTIIKLLTVTAMHN
jgi:hypothetical protein